MLAGTLRMYPAPLKLCFLPGFEYSNDTIYCPTERNALKEFYDFSKGTEWTRSLNWIKPHIRHCDWDGITCDDANNSIKLELQSNGLSGSLTQNISKLRSLEVKVRHVTIHDTILVMKLLAFLFIFVFVVVFLVTIQPGLISTEISLLSNLTHLRLSYNDFTGKDPLAW